MEKEPVKTRLSKSKFGRLVFQKLEELDDAFDIFPDDEPELAIDDTQELDMVAIFNSEQFERGEE